MSLQELQSVLQTQVSARQAIEVSKATLGKANLIAGASFDTIIQSFLKLTGPLSVAVTGDILGPSGNKLAVTGTASFLGVAAASVQVVFTLESDNTVNALVVALLPADWKFSSSFPLLMGFPFAELSITQPAYLLTTAAQTRYTWNEQTLTLSQGLNFASLLGMGGPFVLLQKLVSSLAPSDQVVFTGTVDPTKMADLATGTPALSLTGTIDGPITAKTHFDLSLPQVLLTSETDDNGYLSYWLSFSSTLSVKSEPFSTFQAAILQNSPTLNLSMLPTKKPITPAEIIELIGNVAYTKSIPPVLEDIFQSIGLVGLYAAINVDTMEVLALSGSIGTTSPWTMGQFKIENLVLNCQVLMPFSKSQSELLTFAATASIFPDIFKGDFVVEINYDVTSKAMVIAANFLGTVSLNDLIAGLSGNKIKIPENFAKIEFDDFGMTFTEAGKRYDYTLFGSAQGSFDITILGNPIVATFEVRVDSAAKKYELVGGLTIGNAFFQATADLSAQKQLLSASWTALHEDYLSINDILLALQLPTLDIPSELDLGLKSARITYDITDETFIVTAQSVNYGTAVFASVPVEGKKESFFLLGVDKTFSLSNLPLVGKELARTEKIEVGKIEIVIGSVVANQATATLLNGLITSQFPSGYPLMPDKGMTVKFLLSVQIDFGGTIIPLSTAILKSATPQGAPGVSTVAPPTPAGVPTGTRPAGTPSNPDGTAWLPIQKSFGPVSLKRIGLLYQDGALAVLLDAALSAAGLTISLNGLAVRSPLKAFKPSFHLDGLGLAFAEGPLEIAGAFLDVPPAGDVSFQYDGAIIVAAENFGLMGLGSYAELKGGKGASLFAFAQLDAPLGGPAFFFVTGLAGGLGYNRSLRMPTQNEAMNFPFVRGLTQPPGPGATKPDLLRVLAVLEGRAAGPGGQPPKAWINVQVGQDWIAAGLQFTSFDIIKTNALLIVEFGKTFEIVLLGLAVTRLPQEGPVAYAYIELALEVIMDPAAGLFSATAGLTPNSYVIDPNCHLTGGFAFYIWFAGAHAGDFVLTVGGYHPQFRAPAWYPQVPRLGLNWLVSNTVTIKGDAYFALTPSNVMAGGRLDMLFHSGDLRAWLQASLNMIVVWKPFHYEVTMDLRIGVAYRTALRTWEVELRVTAQMWGPPMGVRAHIKWSVISFTIAFGARRTSPPPLTWDEFQTLLPTPARQSQDKTSAPASAPAVCQVRITRGLLRQVTTAENTSQWIVRAASFTFATETTIPATEVALLTPRDPLRIPSQNGISIRPMGIDRVTTSSHSVRLTNLDTNQDEDLANWAYNPNTRNVPEALWGAPVPQRQGLAPDAKVLADRLVGLTDVRLKEQTFPGTPPIDMARTLGYARLDPEAVNLLPLSPTATGSTTNAPQRAPNTLEIIQKTLMDSHVVAVRSGIFGALQALGMAVGSDDPLTTLSDGPLTTLAANPAAAFEAVPMLGALTAEVAA